VLNETTVFPCHEWLKGAPGSKGNDKVLNTSDKAAALVTYELQVRTSDVRGAGTDSDVFVTIHGARGSTSELELADASDNFERGRKDVFRVSAADVGALEHIKVRPGQTPQKLADGAGCCYPRQDCCRSRMLSPALIHCVIHCRCG